MKTCVVLPTAGADPNNPWLPDLHGVARATTAACLLYDNESYVLAVIGGYENHLRVTLADRLAAFFLDRYPDLKERVVFIDGRTNNTIDDLAGLFNDGPLCDEYIFVSHKDHFKRIKAYRRAVNLRHEDSKETGEPGGVKEKILYLYGLVDPFWKIPGTGHILRKLTTGRALSHRAESQAWAEQDRNRDNQECRRVLDLIIPVINGEKFVGCKESNIRILSLLRTS